MRRTGPARGRPELRLVRGIAPLALTPAAVLREFRARLAAGASLAPAGRARRRPALLLTPRYRPRHALRLFDATYYLADYRFDDAVGFFVGYVALGRDPRHIWPRLFYKDSSLLWRVASHFTREDGEAWIGKGDTREEERDGWVWRHSVEETTNLPYELQFALDELSRRGRKQRDDAALALVVREARPGRLEPFADFTAPRRAAAAAHREHGGRPVARFRRTGDPRSLVFARGYAPDLARGIVEQGSAPSSFFGGEVRKLRVLAENRRVHYLFLASSTHVWLAPPQLLSTELSSFGVRVHDVLAAEELCLPGFEYHDAEGSQIPPGFAGAPHPDNPDRADAAAWLEALPIVRAFRARGLAGPPPTRGRRARLAAAPARRR
ncbi:MAG TPA: hypothetical protein VF530_12305 [Planctomycetota bacterium]